ncbi:MAG: type I 3-dehydroquinate dehydratase [Eubacterium sp.]|nr:type I 3-dehydroquinate dehydratase [Eubacterium sp.]
MKELQCRKITLNSDKPLICVSVTGSNLAEIKEQAKVIKRLNPDIVEWRADCLKIENEEKDTFEIAYALKCVHKALRSYPLIFTFRSKEEGGCRHVNFEKYKEYYHYISLEALKNNVELVDIEMYGKRGVPGLDSLIEEMHDMDLKIIGSFHDFKKTPKRNEILDILKDMEENGADVCKIATMPKHKGDVFSIYNASQDADKELKNPIIAISMGELGAITRVALTQTQSVLTFASMHEDETFEGELRKECIEQMNSLGQVPFKIAETLVDINRRGKLNGNISVIGFMGTGKTTVSKALAEILNCKEVDTDKYLVNKYGKEITEMFEVMTEDEFRDAESVAIEEIAKTTNQIISCGGGAVIRKKNSDVLKKGGVIVRLEANPETIFERVSRRTTRPLLNGNMNIDHIKKLMDERELRYREAADITVNVDSNNRILTCYRIVVALVKRGIIT